MRRAVRARVVPEAPVFYGWYIAAGGGALNLIAFGIASLGLGVLIEPMQQELGWSIAAISLGFSLRSFEQGLLAPISGVLVDRLGPRKMILSGVVLLAGGLLLFSQAHTLPVYYAASVVAALGQSLGMGVPINAAIMNWVPAQTGPGDGDRRGRPWGRVLHRPAVRAARDRCRMARRARGRGAADPGRRDRGGPARARPAGALRPAARRRGLASSGSLHHAGVVAGGDERVRGAATARLLPADALNGVHGRPVDRLDGAPGAAHDPLGILATRGRAGRGDLRGGAGRDPASRGLARRPRRPASALHCLVRAAGRGPALLRAAQHGPAVAASASTT